MISLNDITNDISKAKQVMDSKEIKKYFWSIFYENKFGKELWKSEQCQTFQKRKLNLTVKIKVKTFCRVITDKNNNVSMFYQLLEKNSHLSKNCKKLYFSFFININFLFHRKQMSKNEKKMSECEILWESSKRFTVKIWGHLCYLAYGRNEPTQSENALSPKLASVKQGMIPHWV